MDTYYDEKHPDSGPPEARVVMVASALQAGLVPTALAAARDASPRKLAFSVALVGRVKQEDEGAIPAILSSHDSFEHVKDGGYNETVHRLLDDIEEPLALILPPTVVLQDPNWFGKLQLPFARASYCAVSFVPRGGASAQQAFLWSQRGTAGITSPALTQRRVLRSLHARVAFAANDFDYPAQLALAARGIGLQVFACPGVRLRDVDTPWKREHAANRGA